MAAALLACVLGVAPTGPSDPYTQAQYHFRTVNAPAAWQATRGAGSVVAVLDTGVDPSHPDLRGQLVGGTDIVDPGTAPDDPNGHGTFVAGVVVATAGNGTGGAGVAPRARVMPVRVLAGDSSGSGEDVDEGIRWAVAHGADVINLSLADVPGGRLDPQSLVTGDVERAIREAAQRGVVVVGAAGNGGNAQTLYGRDEPMLVVGATDRDDQVWPPSNRNAETLFAPGVNITSTYPNEVGYATADGTSFAAPVVAGGAALLRAKGLDATTTRQRLEATAADIGLGEGRIDLAAALGVPPDLAQNPDAQATDEASPSRADRTASERPSSPPSAQASPASTPSPSPAARETPDRLGADAWSGAYPGGPRRSGVDARPVAPGSTSEPSQDATAGASASPSQHAVTATEVAAARTPTQARPWVPAALGVAAVAGLLGAVGLVRRRRSSP